ncbi:energy transducer TonB [Lacinutrix salivirga]
MKDLNKSRNLVRQNKVSVKTSQKHDVNLRKNSTLYFQVGLILCLLSVYAALEMNFKAETARVINETAFAETDAIYVVKPFTVEPDTKPEPKVKDNPKTKTQLIDEYDLTEDTNDLAKDLDIVTEPIKPEKREVYDPNKADDPVDEPEPESYSILAVHKVPVFPGCESAGSKSDQIKCMSDKMGKFISKKFDTSVADDLQGKQRIFVYFKINKQGEIEIIKTRAAHKALEREANRVVNKFPKMKPGLVNNKPVEILYTIPITFQVE